MDKIMLDVPSLKWNGHQLNVLKDDNISDDLTIVSALKYVLRYQGYDLPKRIIAGLTGAAFYIGWNSETLQSGMGGSVFQYPHIYNNDLFENTSYCGYNLLFQYLNLDVEIVNKKDSSLFDKCKESLENGIPLSAIEWNPVSRRGHATILSGIDYKEGKFLARIFDHEKYDDYVSVSPRNLLYVILQQDAIKKEIDKERIFLDSLINACNILKGRSFCDNEKWILGIEAYKNQCQMIKDTIEVSNGNYKLIEHFLFWRMQVLLICRTYAQLYISELLDQEICLSNKKYMEEVNQKYSRYLGLFNSTIKIQNDIKSIINGVPLIWRKGDRNIEDILKAKKGKEEFCDFLSELYELDMSVFKILIKVKNNAT